MAGTNLVINILADAADAQKALGKTEDSIGSLGKSSSVMGKAMVAGAAAGATALVALGVDAFNAAAESAKIGRETERVIKSTGAAAWISADQVGELATAISDKTGADDEAIQSGENLLLTFTNVQNAVGEGNNVFDRATEAALDMSTALGTDMSGASIQLGKALNDPVKGLTALGKAGVSFSEDQKTQIKLMQESGDLLGAQKVILGEVEKEFKGAAEAAGTPLDKLKVAIGNVQETIGANLIPPVMAAAEVLTGLLGPAVSGATEFFTKHAAVVEALATAGLVALAASYLHVVEANARLVAQASIEFFTNLGTSVRALAGIFMEAAKSQGILAAAFQTSTLTAAPAVIALAAIAAGVYALRSAMDTSSEAAEKFWDKIQEGVDVSSFASLGKAAADVETRIKSLERSIQAGSGFGDMAASAADLLIPFRDVEGSMRDQQNELTTLRQKQTEHNQAVTDSEIALNRYAENAVLAAAGTDLQSSAAGDAAIENQLLGTSVMKVNDELKAIAQSKGIDIVKPGAVDQVTALWEKTKFVSTSTLQMSEAQEKYNDASATAKDKTDAFKLSLDALTGAHISAAAAETNYSQNQLTMLGTLNKNKDAIAGLTNQTDASAQTTLAATSIVNTNNKAIQDNVKSMLDLAKATYEEKQGTEGQAGALKIATDQMMEHRNQLFNTMIQMGYSEQAANEYLDRLGLTPKNIETQAHLNDQQAKTAIDGVLDGYGKIKKGAEGKVTLFVNGVLQTSFTALEHEAGLRSVTVPGLVPTPMARTADATASATYNITVQSTGLGVDSPRLQRDLVAALKSYERRNGNWS